MMSKQCLNEYEHAYWAKDQSVLGIDEAGRGPLAGPLVVAGVVFEKGYENPNIYDSKSISEKKRQAMFEMIQEDALAFEILVVDAQTIDQLNIYQATKMAMTQIANDLSSDVVITDAMPLNIERECVAVVKGDQKSISIAAGSILAKVTRDQMMVDYDKIYPEYGFASHKGYGTKKHMDALKQYGITPIHRVSYKPVAACLEQQISLFDLE